MLLVFIAASNNYAATQNEAVKIDRLVGLCQLWGQVKFLHPSLAYRSDIDWDAALIKAIPKVQSAETADQYSGAVQEMLAVLDDPLTRVVHTAITEEIGNTADQKFKYELTSDSILIITAGSYFQLWNAENQEKLKLAAAEIPKAKAVIFDLRSATPPGDYGQLQLNSTFGPFERLISSTPSLTRGERRFVHHGYDGSFALSSGQYKSGFFTQNVRRITPAQNAKDVPSIFLLNKNAGSLESVAALQAAGKGLIVFEGDVRDGFRGKTANVDLGEGISAQVRLAEFVLEDGTAGDLVPDKIVSVSTRNSDSALAAALELAQNFKASTAVRKKLPAIAAPNRDRSYPDMKYPSVEYRLLAAFRIWNIIDRFFPYKNLMDRDWTGVLREFIPKFEKAKDGLEYSLAVAEMMTHVHDSHAYVSGAVINEHFGTFYPPVRVRMIENTPVVTAFTNEAVAKAAGVEIGDIVEKVYGEDARARIGRYAKYISASTPHNNLDKATLGFMNGKDSSAVTLTLRDRNKKIKEVKLPRKFEDFTTLYNRERTGDIVKLLSTEIGYADLDRLTGDMIDSMFEKFKDTKAIVFDMRGYPKGVFWILPQRLTDKKEVAAALFDTPIVGDIFAAKSSDSFVQNLFPATPGKSIYKGKTVMLIDERAVSQAEHTGLFLRAANGTKFIGSHTAGANGEVTSFSVPGGIGIGFSGQAVRFPDGRQLQRIGLVPDVEVKPTVKGIRQGRDEVLDRAVKYLNSEFKKRN